MLEDFQTYINKNQLFEPPQKILLAVSAGIDSVTMTHLFHRANFNFSIAHCNFGLRGNESEKDQHFAEDLANKLGVAIHTANFDTQKYADNKKLSIQMAARELRYDWFDELLKNFNYDYLSVATHIDDSIETFMINATKGTGIAGLRGILAKQNKIIRPMLFATKNDILNYASTQLIEYRDDSSNESLKYVRNKIRHQVIPVLKEINPNLETTFQNNFLILQQTERLYNRSIELLKQSLIIESENQIKINLGAIVNLPEKETVLYECIKNFGFNISTIKNILTISQSGKKFFSSTHKGVVNRGFLEITANTEKKTNVTYIEKNQEFIAHPVKLSLKILPSENSATFQTGSQVLKENAVACLDYEKLRFPLLLRLWEPGDYFYPLGMNKKKKLSDFFIDNKLSIHEKENTFVLVSDSDIVWIVGQRISNKYKITGQSKKVFKIEMV